MYMNRKVKYILLIFQLFQNFMYELIS